MPNRALRTAVVLAAGLGSRLSEVTKAIPKTMIEVDGRCIYEHILNSLIDSGIERIIFIVGYQSKLLIPLVNEYAKSKKINLIIVENKEYSQTNTMYSLWLARDHLDESFLYVHGDLIFSTQMLSNFLKYSHENSILVDTQQPLDWDDAMKVIQNDGKLKYMSKCISVNEMDGVAIGMYKFNKEGAKLLFGVINKLISKGVVTSWVSEAINIASKQLSIYVDRSELHAWVDVDNLQDLNMAHIVRSKMELE